MSTRLTPIMMGLLTAGLLSQPANVSAAEYEQVRIADPAGSTQFVLSAGDSVTHAIADSAAIDVSIEGNSLYGDGITVQSGVLDAFSSGIGVKAHQGGQVSLENSVVTAADRTGRGLYATGKGSSIKAVNTSIRIGGAFADGVLAEDGAAIWLEGIDISAKNGNGLIADNASIEVQRGNITLISGNNAVTAKNGGRIVLHNVRIDAPNTWWGIESLTGGEVAMDGGSIHMPADWGGALYALGHQSRITVKNVNIESGGVTVRDGAQVTLESVVLKEGLLRSSQWNQTGAGQRLTMVDTDVNVTSSKSAMYISHGAVTMTGGSITSNEDAVELFPFSADDRVSFTASDATLTSLNTNSLSVLDPTTVVDTRNLVLNALGSSGTGIYANAGDIQMNRFKISAGAFGVLNFAAKIRLLDGTIKTYERYGRGLHVQYSPNWGGDEASVEVAGSTIETLGGGGAGVAVFNRGAVVNLSDSTVTTTGAGSHGLYSSYQGALSARNTVVRTRGANSNAAGIRNGASLTLDGSDLQALGAQSIAISSTSTNADTVNAFSMRGGSHASTEDGIGLLAGGGSHRFTLDNSAITARYQGSEQNGILLQTQATTIQQASGPLQVAAKDVSLDASGSRLVGDVVALDGVVDISLRQQSVLTGAMMALGPGKINRLALDASSAWNVRNDSRVGTLSNAGTVTFVGPNETVGFKTLTVNNYIGGGTLVFNTQLDGDHSPTDRLVVDGGTITGRTDVRIINKGGVGGQTELGIHVIETMNGAVAEPDAFQLSNTSSGYRRSTGTISLNGFDYSLVQGAKDDGQAHWFLSSYNSRPLDPGEGEGEGGGVDPLPENPTGPNPPVEVPEPPGVVDPELPSFPAFGRNVSPESGAYVGNQIAATQLFSHRLRDRVVAQNDGLLRAWSRVQGRHDSGLRMAEGRVSVQRDSALVQVGSDLLRLPMADDVAVYAGVMAGYGDARTRATSTMRLPGRDQDVQARARGKVSGYAVGVYATAYQNDATRLGAYGDAWLQAGRYRNDITSDVGAARYDSTVWSASVEAGYAMRPFEENGALGRIVLEPQAQWQYSRYSAQNADLQGTRLQNDSKHAWQSRVGARLYSQAEQTLRPFVELNWLHRSGAPSVLMGDTAFHAAPARNAMELSLGAQGGAGRMQVSAQLFGQAGSDSQRAVGGMLNVAYRW